MIRLGALVTVVLAGCAISTDSFKGHGASGEWVKDSSFTKQDFEHDLIACRADTYRVAEDQAVEAREQYAYFAMMRARQGMAQCLHERGWRRVTEHKRPADAK